MSSNTPNPTVTQHILSKQKLLGSKPSNHMAINLKTEPQRKVQPLSNSLLV